MCTVSTAKFDQKYAKNFGRIQVGVEFRVASNIGSQWSVPEEMVGLSGLVELPVVELSGADCTLHSATVSIS